MTALPALALLLAAGAPQVLSVDAASSAVRYHVHHALHEVNGTSHSVEGKAVLEPDGTVKTMVRIPVQSFDSGDANRDSHMLVTLEAGRYPHVVFKGVARLDRAGPAGQALPLTLRGELELHGVRRAVEVPVTVEFAADGSARVTGRLTVSLEAHHIERPSLLMVKLDDACAIELDLKLGRAG